MPGEPLLNRDDHAVMKRAGVRDVVVDNLGERHADGREEDSLGRLAKPEVLARRRANDD